MPVPADAVTERLPLLTMVLPPGNGQAHIESYVPSTLQAYGDNPLFQFVQINCQENSLKWILVGIFVSGLKRSVPAEHKNNYLLSTENLEYLREVRAGFR